MTIIICSPLVVLASKLNAVNNLVRKNLSNNNNNNDNNDNTNEWSSDLWSDSTPKSITNKLLKLLDSSGLKGKMQIRKSSRSSSSSSSSSMRRQRAHNRYNQIINHQIYWTKSTQTVFY